ncbi:MAG: tetratricopeptide repeat protein [Armatimonadia bacterium]|nr:tetratricopeptide repeat protein [Armatimonadia bacterium]
MQGPERPTPCSIRKAVAMEPDAGHSLAVQGGVESPSKHPPRKRPLPIAALLLVNVGLAVLIVTSFYRLGLHQSNASAHAHIYSGHIAFSKSAYYNAIEDFNRAIDLDPDCAEAYDWRGRAYYELGEYERAIRDFDRAISLKPDEPGFRERQRDALIQRDRGEAR